MKRVLVVVGTRPEAVKLAPIVRAAALADDLALDVVWTGQHAGLVAPHAAQLGVAPPGGPARGATPGALRRAVRQALRTRRADAVLAQGDTASVVAAAEVAHAADIPFVHVEAGLRSGSLEHPWPEEHNRVRVGRLATLHLAPTRRAASNLLGEGVDRSAIVVTGNTIVDAARHELSTLEVAAPSARLARFEAERPRVLFTHHRRESFPHGAASVMRAIAALAEAHPALEVVMPAHPNPALASVLAPLSDRSNVHRVPPLDHRELLWLLGRCRFAVTDSGGIQEEAPSVGVPVLVTRRTTERPEALERGWARLVGWDREIIEADALRWLRDEGAWASSRPSCNPFGDGHAAARCVQALRCVLGLSSRPPASWTGPAAAA
ncbi:MAG: UDP-N-acetylglucosamine 2-epimerase (non-hydrolyzing) [bacterium]|nr:UDP-N-acetylglucosamine 2-epimerase (non-hydrolyzing) [bacterium]